MDDRGARPPGDPRVPAGSPTARQRWAALAGQQQAVIALSTVAIILMVIILIVLLTSGDDDDQVAGIDATPTPSPTAQAVVNDPTPTVPPAPADTPVPEPTLTPVPPTPTLPPATPTPEPEPTITPEPTATLEPTPEPPTPTPPPATPTLEPEPTATPEPEPITGEARVEDRENDVFTPDGEQPPDPIPLIDLQAVELEVNDDNVQVRFFAGDDIPANLDDGVIVAWTLVIWIEDQETYRISATLEGDQTTIGVLDVETGDALAFPDDPATNDEELEIELPLNQLERLAGPFAWAGMSMIETADGQVYGDNAPDAGDMFTENPEPSQGVVFPE